MDTSSPSSWHPGMLSVPLQPSAHFSERLRTSRSDYLDAHKYRQRHNNSIGSTSSQRSLKKRHAFPRLRSDSKFEEFKPLQFDAPSPPLTPVTAVPHGDAWNSRRWPLVTEPAHNYQEVTYSTSLDRYAGCSTPTVPISPLDTATSEFLAKYSPTPSPLFVNSPPPAWDVPPATEYHNGIRLDSPPTANTQSPANFSSPLIVDFKTRKRLPHPNSVRIHQPPQPSTQSSSGSTYKLAISAFAWSNSDLSQSSSSGKNLAPSTANAANPPPSLSSSSGLGLKIDLINPDIEATRTSRYSGCSVSRISHLATPPATPTAVEYGDLHEREPSIGKSTNFTADRSLILATYSAPNSSHEENHIGIIEDTEKHLSETSSTAGKIVEEEEYDELSDMVDMNDAVSLKSVQSNRSGRAHKLYGDVDSARNSIMARVRSNSQYGYSPSSETHAPAFTSVFAPPTLEEVYRSGSTPPSNSDKFASGPPNSSTAHRTKPLIIVEAAPSFPLAYEALHSNPPEPSVACSTAVELRAPASSVEPRAEKLGKFKEELDIASHEQVRYQETPDVLPARHITPPDTVRIKSSPPRQTTPSALRSLVGSVRGRSLRKRLSALLQTPSKACRSTNPERRSGVQNGAFAFTYPPSPAPPRLGTLNFGRENSGVTEDSLDSPHFDADDRTADVEDGSYFDSFDYDSACAAMYELECLQSQLNSLEPPAWMVPRKTANRELLLFAPQKTSDSDPFADPQYEVIDEYTTSDVDDDLIAEANGEDAWTDASGDDVATPEWNSHDDISLEPLPSHNTLDNIVGNYGYTSYYEELELTLHQAREEFGVFTSVYPSRGRKPPTVLLPDPPAIKTPLPLHATSQLSYTPDFTTRVLHEGSLSSDAPERPRGDDGLEPTDSAEAISPLGDRVADEEISPSPQAARSHRGIPAVWQNRGPTPPQLQSSPPFQPPTSAPEEHLMPEAGISLAAIEPHSMHRIQASNSWVTVVDEPSHLGLEDSPPLRRESRRISQRYRQSRIEMVPRFIEEPFANQMPLTPISPLLPTIQACAPIMSTPSPALCQLPPSPAPSYSFVTYSTKPSKDDDALFGITLATNNPIAPDDSALPPNLEQKAERPGHHRHSRSEQIIPLPWASRPLLRSGTGLPQSAPHMFMPYHSLDHNSPSGAGRAQRTNNQDAPGQYFQLGDESTQSSLPIHPHSARVLTRQGRDDHGPRINSQTISGWFSAHLRPKHKDLCPPDEDIQRAKRAVIVMCALFVFFPPLYLILWCGGLDCIVSWCTDGKVNILNRRWRRNIGWCAFVVSIGWIMTAGVALIALYAHN